MIRVSLELGSGDGSFVASVRARSIGRAITLVNARYPGCEARILFPLDTESFFVNNPMADTEFVEPVVPTEMAG